MIKLPNNNKEFYDRLKNKSSSYNFFFDRIFRNGFVCPRCGNKSCREKTRDRLVCTQCKKETNIRTGTLMEGSHIPAVGWVRAIWTAVNEQSLKNCFTDYSPKTRSIILNKIRKTMNPAGAFILEGLICASLIPTKSMKSILWKHISSDFIFVGAEIGENRIGKVQLRCSYKYSREYHNFLRYNTDRKAKRVYDNIFAKYPEWRKIYRNPEKYDSPPYLRRNIGWTKGLKIASEKWGVKKQCKTIILQFEKWFLKHYGKNTNITNLDYYLNEFVFFMNMKYQRKYKRFLSLIDIIVDNHVPLNDYRLVVRCRKDDIEAMILETYGRKFT